MSEVVRKLVSELFSDDLRQRMDAADGFVDVIREIGPRESAIVSRALCVAIWIDKEEDAAEAYMHAFSELAEWGKVDRREISLILDLWKLDQDQSSEYVEFLASQLIELETRERER